MKVNENFIINLQGKSFVTYEGLLDLAHKNKLKSLEVNIIQFPNQENQMTAICEAIAKTEDMVFKDIGDASPRSVNSTLAPHLIRMASTRAKARVLRDLTNVGITAFEELSFDENNNIQTSDGYMVMEDEAPTKRQIETLEKLAEQLNQTINYNDLNKKTAGSLISKMLDETRK